MHCSEDRTNWEDIPMILTHLKSPKEDTATAKERIDNGLKVTSYDKDIEISTVFEKEKVSFKEPHHIHVIENGMHKIKLLELVSVKEENNHIIITSKLPANIEVLDIHIDVTLEPYFKPRYDEYLK